MLFRSVYEGYVKEFSVFSSFARIQCKALPNFIGREESECHGLVLGENYFVKYSLFFLASGFVICFSGRGTFMLVFF